MKIYYLHDLFSIVKTHILMWSNLWNIVEHRNYIKYNNSIKYNQFFWGLQNKKCRYFEIKTYYRNTKNRTVVSRHSNICIRIGALIERQFDRQAKRQTDRHTQRIHKHFLTLFESFKYIKERSFWNSRINRFFTISLLDWFIHIFVFLFG